MYCAVKDGKAYEGDTKEKVLNQVCKIELEGKTRLLSIKVKGFKDYKFHSYEISFTDLEIIKDAITFMYTKLPDFGFTLYKKEL